MTNQEINLKLGQLVKVERKTTLEILKLINLAEDRKLYLEFAYPSIYEWLIKEHKYSDRAANRRVQAARLLRAVPSASGKIENGSVNLTTLAKAQSMIRTQERVSGKKVTMEARIEAIQKIENQSTLKAEQTLMSLFPENRSQIRQDRITVINETTQRLGINLPNEAIADLNRAVELLSHTVPSGQASEVIAHVLRDFVKRHDPLLKKKNGAALAQRISVLRRAEGKCQYKDPITGRVCGGRFRIERDHIIPRALGGDDSLSNARALCRRHNQFMAKKILNPNLWRSP